jgi:Mg-chelatase subunit ChlD
MPRVFVLLAMLALIAAGVPQGSQVSAQDDEDAEATIAALQTQIAELEDGEAEPTEEPRRRQTPTPEAEEVEGEATAEPRSRRRSTPEAEREVQEEEALSEASVNVQVIFDVSGSMAQVLDTGETRMDAAKRVLSGVVAAIPDREGINVGLRIYGHEGNNTEEGREESCESSELVVPVEGVDKEALEEEVEALQPTGWTPIGLSLERAEEDFPDATEDVTNAVILVTDGLETCGGDPAEAAGALLEGDKEIVTNVIGFALTGEEQELLASIANAGEGQLLGAQNAEELSSALFSVLEELEIVAGTGFVGGNAFTLLEAGESGEVSVIAAGTVDNMVGGSIPFVVRNNTSEDVSDVKVTGTLRDANGRVAGAANGLLMTPNRVNPGGVSFGQAYFGDTDIPAGATVEFNAEATPADEVRFNSFRDLDVTEASLFENRIVGTLENTYDESVKGTIAIQAVCFDLDGNLLNLAFGSVDTGNVDPGEEVPFQVTLFYGDPGQGCPAFLVAGYGYEV